MQLITVPVTTDASGDFSQQTPVLNGRLVQYRYVPDGSSPLDTGADLDIVGTTTGIVVANQDDIGTSAFTKAPRQATHGVDGSASLYASTGEPVEDVILIVGETLTLTIANGGNAKAGTFYLWVEDPR